MEIKKNVKKHWVRNIILSLIIIPIICLIVFIIIYPTQYPFVDMQILGSTADEIVEIYGEPISRVEKRLAYMVTQEPLSFETRRLMWNNSMPREGIWYAIYFDDNGIAQSVKLKIQDGG